MVWQQLLFVILGFEEVEFGDSLEQVDAHRDGIVATATHFAIVGYSLIQIDDKAIAQVLLDKVRTKYGLDLFEEVRVILDEIEGHYNSFGKFVEVLQVKSILDVVQIAHNGTDPLALLLTQFPHAHKHMPDQSFQVVCPLEEQFHNIV